MTVYVVIIQAQTSEDMDQICAIFKKKQNAEWYANKQKDLSSRTYMVDAWHLLDTDYEGGS